MPDIPSPTTVPQTEAEWLRQIDGLVHVHVIGKELPKFITWTDGSLSGSLAVRSYTTSWDAAGEVVERMRELGWNVSIVFKDTFPRHLWRVDFEKPREMLEGSDRGETVALCIARAALRALGVAEVPERTA